MTLVKIRGTVLNLEKVMRFYVNDNNEKLITVLSFCYENGETVDVNFQSHDEAENALNYIFRAGKGIVGTNTIIDIDDWLKRTREIKQC